MLRVDSLHPLLTWGMVSAEKKKLLFVFIASQAEEAINGVVSHWFRAEPDLFFWFSVYLLFCFLL